MNDYQHGQVELPPRDAHLLMMTSIRNWLIVIAALLGTPIVFALIFVVVSA